MRYVADTPLLPLMLPMPLLDDVLRFLMLTLPLCYSLMLFRCCCFLYFIFFFFFFFAPFRFFAAAIFLMPLSFLLMPPWS